MRKSILTTILTCACVYMHAQVIITTIAGTGIAGYSGDNELAINAMLNNPEGLCFDNSGNLLIADPGNNRIRKLFLSTGTITTIAGTGGFGYSGDDGLATSAQMFIPCDVFKEKDGNILIADAGNNRIRRLNISTGIINLVAGNGMSGYSGDGSTATNAKINEPPGICADQSGNIYIAEYFNHRIRKIDALTGIITTVAGTGIIGYSGDNGPATNARLFSPAKPFADTQGNIVFTEADNHVVRKIWTKSGKITTIAGNGSPGYRGDGGLAVNAQLNTPVGVFVDTLNNIFIAEYGNAVIRRIDGTSGIISTIAGNDTAGYSGDGGPPTHAKLYCNGVTVGMDGTVYIADYQNNRIRKVYNTVGLNNVIQTIEVKAYPNPAKDNLIIEQAQGSHVQIFDFNGKLVFQMKIISDKENLDIDKLTPGPYLIEIIDAQGEKKINKLVILK